MPGYHLTQLNIALMREPLESPSMADFVANLDRINALAEQAPGFVWRLEDEPGEPPASHPFGENVLVNMSVWEGIESLHDYAFRSDHADILRRRREWFQKMQDAYAVLWWIPAGHRPTVHEAADRLAHLQSNGPTPQAFTFRDSFPPPAAAQADPGVSGA
jgi:hypothetical protein